MARAKLAARIAGIIVGMLFLVAAIFTAVLTSTDWGRERVRSFALTRIASSVNGELRIERLRGDLLSGALLENVTLEDTAGRPFLSADTVSIRYSLRNFLSGDLILSDVLLVRPVLALHRSADGAWNFARMFRAADSVAAPADTAAAARMRLEDVTLQDATVVVRTVLPADAPALAAASNAARPASWIVEIDGTPQQLMLFRDIDARMPLIRVSDPDSSAILVTVDTASLEAFPIRPPGVRVHDLSGGLVVAGDTMRLDSVALGLAASRISADGEYRLTSGDLAVALNVDTLSFADLRWIRPDLPAGGGSGRFAVARSSDRASVAAQDMALQLDGGDIAGGFEVQLGDTVRIGEADLRFDGIDTRMLERIAGGEALPVDGIANGNVRLSDAASGLAVDGLVEFGERGGGISRVRAGGVLASAADGGVAFEGFTLDLDPVEATLLRRFAPDMDVAGEVTGVATVTGTTRTALRLDADLAHDGAGTGRSRVLADGTIDLRDEPVARDLRLRFAPLRIGLIERLAADLPMTGTIEGTATVNGSPLNRLRARVDLRHAADAGESRVEGTAEWRQSGAFAVDLHAPVLDLAALSAPAADSARLRGTASGTVRASGTTSRFGFDADLALARGGGIVADGTLDLRSGTPAYDVRATVDSLDLQAAVVGAPGSRLTGWLNVRGQGTDPALLDATVDAQFIDSHLGEAMADTSVVRARIAGGTATLSEAELRVGGATASFAGTIGLVEGRTGTLDYRIDVPRLEAFAQYIPTDTGVVARRPVAQARRTALARSDSLERALDTAVQRAAVGYPQAPTLEVDSVRPLARDSVAGSVQAEGTLSGSLRRLSAEGTLSASDVVAAGMTVRDVRATYALSDFGTPDAEARLELAADSPNVAGFAFDSAGIQLALQGVRDDGTGTLDVSLFQDPDRDYRIASEFMLELDRREITLNEMVMRFDTIEWLAPHSGVLSWAGTVITVDSLELLNPAGGRILIDGSIDDEGGDMSVEAEHVPVAQIAALLQDTVTFAGLMDLQARMRGTPESPRFEGTFAMTAGSVEERPLPDTRISFDYADALLRADASLFRAGLPLLDARARLPIDLALRGVEGPRLLEQPLNVQLHADSLPLETLPGFTDAVSDVRGRMRGDVVAGGTWEEPVLTGQVDLDLASFRIVPAGLWLRDIAGAVRFDGDVITVDSLNGTSGGGPIRVTGGVDVERLTRPVFDLRVSADNAIAFDTDQGRVRTDAELTITGPMDSARIEGDVHVRNGLVMIPNVGETRRVTPLDPATVTPLVDTMAVDDATLVAPMPLLQNLTADVTLRVARDMWVRNDDANVEIYTPDDAEPLRVRYNVDRPGLSLSGVINADRGEYEFSGRLFELTTGAVTFLPATEALDPLIQLSANYEVRRSGQEALIIQIHLTGSLTEPRVALESTADPPIPQSDLLSYLAFGRSASSVLDTGSGITGGSDSPGGIADVAQQQIASLALGALIDDAMSNLEREGGRALDVFRIHPAPLPDELAFESAFDNFLRGTEIQAGKYLARGLFFAVEGRPSGESWPGMRLEYETTTGFTWQALWEPRYLPTRPTFRIEDTALTRRVLGTFLYWSRRF